MAWFASSPSEADTFIHLASYSSALGSPVCRTISAFLGTDVHHLSVERGQADGIGAKRKVTILS